MSQRRGTEAEQLAETWLGKQGLRPITRNFQVPGGELDLVMRDSEVLVFLEVRHRSGSRHGSAAESITTTKQQRLIRAAQHFLLRNPALRKLKVRFDVVTFDGPLETPPQWLRDAFRS